MVRAEETLCWLCSGPGLPHKGLCVCGVRSLQAHEHAQAVGSPGSLWKTFCKWLHGPFAPQPGKREVNATLRESRTVSSSASGQRSGGCCHPLPGPDCAGYRADRHVLGPPCGSTLPGNL